jgi:hypothetical protein
MSIDLDAYKAYAKKTQTLSLRVTRLVTSTRFSDPQDGQVDDLGTITPPADPNEMQGVLGKAFGPGTYRWVLREGGRWVAQGQVTVPYSSPMTSLRICDVCGTEPRWVIDASKPDELSVRCEKHPDQHVTFNAITWLGAQSDESLAELGYTRRSDGGSSRRAGRVV